MAIMSLFGTGLFAQAGSIDPTFVPSGSVNVPEFDGVVTCLAIQPDGKVLAAGNFQHYAGIFRNRIARLERNGNLDESFNTALGFDETINAIALQADGRIVVGGLFSSFNGVTRNRIARLNPDGSLDTYFDPSTGFDGNHVYALAIQPDGKIIVGGEFDHFQGTAISKVARLHPNGTLDQSFNIGSGVPWGRVQALTIQPDGKIVVGGLFYSFNGQPQASLFRIHANGSLDLSFHTGSFFNEARVSTLLLSPDGKIYVGGNLPPEPSGYQPHVTRLLPDGSRDVTFNTGAGFDFYVYSLALQPDGKLLVGGGFSAYQSMDQRQIARLYPNGDLDASFKSHMGSEGAIHSLILQPNGNLIAGGSFDVCEGTDQNKIVRLLPDGSREKSFDATDFSYLGFENDVRNIECLPDGKILVGGDFVGFCGEPAINGIVRLNPGGDLDMTFNGSENLSVPIQTKVMAVQPDGKVILGAKVFDNPGGMIYSVIRINSDGSKDGSFEVTDYDGYVTTLAIQADGKILVGGIFEGGIGLPRKNIVRLLSDGTIDNTFIVGTGFDGLYGLVNTIIIQPDGKILVGGDFTSYNGILREKIARLGPNGSLDLSFNLDPTLNLSGWIRAISIQQDGSLIVKNGGSSFTITKLNSNGSKDVSFTQGSGTGDWAEWETPISIQADGKILLPGDTYNGVPQNKIFRLNPDGSLDDSFVGDSIALDWGGVEAIAIQEDGKVLIGGFFNYEINGRRTFAIARLLGDATTAIDPGQTPNSRLSLYPNPNDGRFTLLSDRPLVQANLRLVNLQGQLIRQEENLNGREWNLDYAGLAPGIYLLQISEETKATSLRLVVK